MEILRHYQLNLMLVLSSICFATVIYIGISKGLPEKRRRLFILLGCVAMALLTFEQLSYAYRGNLTEMGGMIVRISNFMVFFLPAVIIYLYTNFLINLLMDEGGLQDVPRLLRVVKVLAILDMLAPIVNLATGLIYTIGPDHLYKRSSTFICYYVVPMVIFPLLLISIIYYGRHLSFNMTAALIFCSAFPMVASIIQIYTYGISLASIALVVPILLVFVIEQMEINRKIDLANRLEVEQLNGYFDILANEASPEYAVDRILGLAGEYYQADRVYVFEEDRKTGTISNTYEWCAPGVVQEKEFLQNLPIDLIRTWKEAFEKKGVLIIRDLEAYKAVDEDIYHVLEPQGIQSMMAFPITIAHEFEGFVGVDNPGKFSENYNMLSILQSMIQGEILNIRNAQKDREAGKLEEKNRKLEEVGALQRAYEHQLEEQHKELQHAFDEAKLANEAKTIFLSNMSHDIRTPMNAIVGFTDMAMRHKENQELVLDCLQKIDIASDQLLALINDVLDMSKIESGKLVISEEPLSLEEFCENLENMFATEARKKQINFQIIMDTVTHKVVRTDRKYMDRILMNIISNSLKFTGENGMVRVTVEESAGTEEDIGSYQFTIQDNGIGMTPEFLTKIYEPFERERTSTVSQLQGTGLGMAIVKNLVQRLNGTIEIDSARGSGTTTVVTLPLTTLEEIENRSKHTEVNTDALTGRYVLLVDDTDINREVASMFLEELGMIVDEATNGQEAVEMFKAKPTLYDIILMDVQMPVMNGHDATRAIRALDIPQGKEVPIVAMTADAFAEDRAKALEAGMNDHIAKPIDIPKLSKVLLKFLVD